MTQGNLGLGEAYMDKWWEVKKLDEFFYRVLRHGLAERVGKSWIKRIANFQSLFLNMQNRIRSKVVIRKHYDIGNDRKASKPITMNVSTVCGSTISFPAQVHFGPGKISFDFTTKGQLGV